MAGQGQGPVHPAGRGTGELLTMVRGAISHLPLDVHIVLDREGRWGWLSQWAQKGRARRGVIWWTTWGVQDWLGVRSLVSPMSGAPPSMSQHIPNMVIVLWPWVGQWEAG